MAEIASGEKIRHKACPVKVSVVDLMLGETVPPFAEVTQLARASAFQAESCGFESRLPLKNYF